MLTQENFKRIIDISISIINKYSKNWNKCTVFTGYCHGNYNSFSLTYQDLESKEFSYWGELYSNIANDEMYSFEGYNHINEILKKHYLSCQNDSALRWNKGTLTIYPSGEYLSEFIWDNEMYLSYCLADIENWLTSYFEQSAYRIEDKCIQLGIKWDFDVKVVISFTSGKANPVLFVAANKPEINFKLYLDQLCECIEGDYIEAFEQWSITRVEDAYYVGLVLENEEMYHSMNYGELKGRFQHWNSAAFIINKTNWQNLTFEDIKFEWKEENA